MEIKVKKILTTKSKVREMLTKAFKQGQKSHMAEDSPIKVWVEEQIMEMKNG